MTTLAAPLNSPVVCDACLATPASPVLAAPTAAPAFTRAPEHDLRPPAPNADAWRCGVCHHIFWTGMGIAPLTCPRCEHQARNPSLPIGATCHCGAPIAYLVRESQRGHETIHRVCTDCYQREFVENEENSGAWELLYCSAYGCEKPAVMPSLIEGMWMCAACAVAGEARMRRAIFWTGPHCTDCGEPLEAPGVCADCAPFVFGPIRKLYASLAALPIAPKQEDVRMERGRLEAQAHRLMEALWQAQQVALFHDLPERQRGIFDGKAWKLWLRLAHARQRAADRWTRRMEQGRA